MSAHLEQKKNVLHLYKHDHFVSELNRAGLVLFRINLVPVYGLTETILVHLAVTMRLIPFYYITLTPNMLVSVTPFTSHDLRSLNVRLRLLIQ